VTEKYLDTRTANHLAALMSEVEILKGRIQPHDTGHIHTTINVLESRITELRESVKAEAPVQHATTTWHDVREVKWQEEH